MRLVLLVVIALAAACAPLPPGATRIPATTTPPQSGAAATETTVATPLPSTTPLPATTAGVRATAAGSIPDAFRYVALDTAVADGVHTRLWLVDLAARRAPVVVAEWDAPASPVGDHSIAGDGRTILVSAAGKSARVALYVVRPDTGTVRVLFEDSARIVISPRISPDGSRYAFTAYPAGGGGDLGVWAGAISGGDPQRIADPTTADNVPAIPLAWSPDGAWLAFTRDVSLDRTEVHLVARDGGKEIVVGEGDRVAWRAAAPQLLVAIPSTPISRAYTFDLATGATKDVATATKAFIGSLVWHPTMDRFVYVESEGAGREASGGIWIRKGDGTELQRVNAPSSAYAPEFSADGSRFTVLTGGDAALVPIIALPAGTQVSVLCRRGGTPPGSCL